MVKPSRPEVLVVGVVAACAVASVAVMLWEKWPKPEVFGTKGEWVGALASFAAALTAVAIAFWSQRRNKIESMMEGAFEIVAADYVIRQIRGQTTVFRLHVKNHLTQLTTFNDQISQCEEQIEAAQEAQVLNPPESASPMNQLSISERKLEKLAYQRDEHSTKALARSASYAESLQTQTSTLSHVKMAAFDPAIGLAVVKVKALLRRSEGLAKLAATTSELLECLNEVLELLATVEAGLSAAERHIKQTGQGH